MAKYISFLTKECYNFNEELDTFMSENKFLNEEKYQKAEKTITFIAALILIVGLCIGSLLIFKGVANPGAAKAEELKTKLENKKSELEAKGVKYSAFTKYSDGEAYDLKVIANALDPSFSYCSFDEYKNNSLTKEYCTAKNSIGNFTSSSSTAFGIFICFATCIVSGSIFMIAKRRHMLAFSVQQVMPIVKEGIDELTPTAKKVTEEMAPAYGKVAKEIAKGIKKGLNDEKK